jgi:NADPH2:quinone reductase
MERAAHIQHTGGPEVIEWTDVQLAEPGLGEVRMRNTAIGLNFIDTYHRSGLYPMPMPIGLGIEAAGVIEAVGQGVADWRVGDRVATFGPNIGAYCTARNIPANRLFLVPDGISDEVAAAGLVCCSSNG